MEILPAANLRGRDGREWNGFCAQSPLLDQRLPEKHHSFSFLETQAGVHALLIDIAQRRVGRQFRAIVLQTPVLARR